MKIVNGKESMHNTTVLCLIMYPPSMWRDTHQETSVGGTILPCVECPAY